MSPPLTDRQARILAFITAYVRRRGSGPSVRELMLEFGVTSPNGMLCHLHALRKKGAIVWEPKEARTIRPTRLPTVSFRVPLGGKILPDGTILLNASALSKPTQDPTSEEVADRLE